MSVATLLSMPRASGLFAKAITQSGAGQAAADQADAALVAKELGLVLGLDPTGESLAAVVLPALWISFAGDGDPGWPALDPSCPVMVFDADDCAVRLDPRGDERRIWSACRAGPPGSLHPSRLVRQPPIAI
jgi:carboxylesterase type B